MSTVEFVGPVGVPARADYSFPIVTAAFVIALGAVILPLEHFGTTTAGWRIAVTYSERWSEALFLVIAVIGPVIRLIRDRRLLSLLHKRRQFGLAFAGSCAVYLCALVGSFVTMHKALPPQTLALCLTCGVVLGVMAATSNAWAIRMMGFDRWSALHRMGIYFFWTIFALLALDRSYSPNHSDVTPQISLLLLTAVLLVRYADCLVRHRVRAKVARNSL